MSWLRWILVAVLGVAALVVIVVFGIGWYLAPQDALKKSDAIVVVSGGETAKRTDEGVRLWKQGWAPKLIFAGAAADQGTSNAAVMRAQAVAEGVPIEQTIIEEKSATTRENAEFLKPIFEQQNIHSAILVSSPYHTRRVKTTFKKVFGAGYTFIAHPALDPHWSRSNWWQQPATTALTWDELRKTIFVTLFQR